MFAENVRKLLLAAPFGPKAVLGVDPGLRTGCKLAVVDASGRTSAATSCTSRRDGGQGGGERRSLAELVQEAEASARSPSATAPRGRETETFVREALRRAAASTCRW